MKNVSLIKLRLNKARRNLQDFLKISYVDGAIGGNDQRYTSIWEDYQSARNSLLEIDGEFFSSLDDIQLPSLMQVRSFFDKGTTYMGYPARSRDTINAAIDNALTYINKYEEIKLTPAESSDEVTESAALVIRIMNNWSNMISSFKEHRADVKPIEVKNEYEMQYLLEGILRLLFDDVRAETYTANYANKSNRTDFLLPKQRILIETKMTRPGLDGKRLAEELIIDKEHYRKHPDIEIILCLVYDPDRRIKNPEGIKDIQELVEPPYFSIHFSN
jgi:hypothetical protein